MFMHLLWSPIQITFNSLKELKHLIKKQIYFKV